MARTSSVSGCSLIDCELKDVVNSEAYENIAPYYIILYYISLFCAAYTVAEVQSSGLYISMPVSTSVQFLLEKLGCF